MQRTQCHQGAACRWEAALTFKGDDDLGALLHHTRSSQLAGSAQRRHVQQTRCRAIHWPWGTSSCSQTQACPGHVKHPMGWLPVMRGGTAPNVKDMLVAPKVQIKGFGAWV